MILKEKKSKSASKLIAIALAIAMVFTGGVPWYAGTEAYAEEGGSSTGELETQVAKDLKKIEDYFKGKTGSSEGYIIFTTKDSNTSTKTQYGGLVKFGTGEGEYDNALVYLKAKAAELTGRNESEIKVTGNTTILKGTYAYGKPFQGITMDADGKFTRPKGDEFTTPGVMSITFEIEGKTLEVGSVWFAVEPEDLTDEQKIDFETQAVTWDAIKKKNSSMDKVVGEIGLEGYPGGLNFKPQLYTKSVKFETKFEYSGADSDPGAMKWSGGRVTVKRPNVGEADAPYKLTVTAKAGEVTKDIEFDLKVPAFEGYQVPIRIRPEGATLEITDPYYREPVAGKYIEKNGNLWTYTLHPQSSKWAKYSWKLSKDGYISKEGDFPFVEGDVPSEMNLELQQSTEKDAFLKNLSIKEPAPGSSTIVQPMEAFEENKTDYTLRVGSSVKYVDINPEVLVEGASFKINAIKYPSDVDTGEQTENGKTKCYLKKAEDTKITITVTAPESSTQEDSLKTKIYTLTVSKDDKVYPLDGVSIEAVRSRGSKNERAKEESFFPSVESGGHADEYTAYVNYTVDSVKLTPSVVEELADKIIGVAIDGKALALTAFPYEKKLKEGLNEVNVKITYNPGDDIKEIDYKFVIIKKKKLLINGIDVKGGSPRSRDGDWVITNLYPEENKEIKFTLDIDDDAVAYIDDIAGEYKKGEEITIPAGKNGGTVIPIIHLKRSVSENGKTWEEKQAFVVSFYGRSPDYPTDVLLYLPAPGQFVNEAAYCNAMATKAVSSGNMVTLGSYGGSIIYYYKDGIENSKKNPYGIDFIVYGNAFTNSDGTSALGAAEPAAVQVSSDGEHWAELAGSLFYDPKTRHNIKLKYTNPDPTFTQSAQDVPWLKNGKTKGAVLANGYHTQPYYPNPSIYNKYNQGKYANKTYSANEMTVEGWSWFTDKPAPRYGYADTHANKLINGKVSNEAVNPYVSRHDMTFNGDGFDLSWSVGVDGTPTNPAYINKVYWVKIYNPNMYDGGSIGECSPEIVGMSIAKQHSDGEVGKSSGLTSLTINGKEVVLPSSPYVNTINFDANGASSLKFTPVAEDADSNIVINDTWVASGEMSRPIAVSGKARIIVQQGIKEPKIYTLNISNVPTIETNTELEKISILPTGEELKANADGAYAYELDEDMASFKIKALPANQESKISIDDEALSEKLNEWTSKAMTIEKGEKKDVVIKVVSEDGTKNKEYTISITRKKSESSSSTPSTPADDSIKVKFELIGDSKHYEDKTKPGTHNPKVWIGRKTVKIPKNSTVKYLTDKELLNLGIDFITKNRGTYISKIQIPGTSEFLGEFDNGPNSGWMYRHNGKIADEGYAARILKDSDSIKWFYTDDYTKETGYEGNWDEVNKESNKSNNTSSGGGGVGAAGDKKETVVENKAESITSKVEIKATVDKATGKAEAKIDNAKVKDQLADMVKQAEKAEKEGKKEVVKELKLEVKADKAAKAVEAVIPKEAVKNMAEKADAVKIDTNLGTVSLDKEALKDLSAKAEKEVSVVLEKKTVADTPLANATEADKKKAEGRPIVELKATADGKRADIKGNLTVSLKYEQKASEEPEAVVVYKVLPNGAMVVVKRSEFDASKDAVSMDVSNAAGTYVIGYNKVEFADANNHWAEKNITFLAAREVVKGKSEGNFEPNGKVTRAEFVQILANLSGADISVQNASKFGDVKADSWYAGAVAWAVENDITSGVGDGNFAPNAAISRQDMAVMIERYLKSGKKTLNVKNKEVKFTDAQNVSSYAKTAVSAMQRAGVINGVPAANGSLSFNPTASASRAETATMIANYIKN